MQSQSQRQKAAHLTNQMAAAIRLPIPPHTNNGAGCEPIGTWQPAGSQGGGEGPSLLSFAGCQCADFRLCG
jgi:hypothetical protein